MPYDPTKPATGSPLSSAEMRSQFTGLQDNLTAATQDKVSLGQLNTELTAAIATTARNPSGMSAPNFSFSNPPSDAELYALQSWLVDFYNSLYRAP